PVPRFGGEGGLGFLSRRCEEKVGKSLGGVKKGVIAVGKPNDPRWPDANFCLNVSRRPSRRPSSVTWSQCGGFHEFLKNSRMKPQFITVGNAGGPLATWSQRDGSLELSPSLIFLPWDFSLALLWLFGPLFHLKIIQRQ
ncbi:hypothetical protein HAX54_022323, partial [Datura stramonium]|nr:hypothetical protein [Datura stramonium]